MANSIFRLEQWQYLEWQAALACLHAHTLCRMVTKGALLHSAAGYRQPRLSSRSAEGWSVGILLWEASKEQLQSAKALRCIFHTEKKEHAAGNWRGKSLGKRSSSFSYRTSALSIAFIFPHLISPEETSLFSMKSMYLDAICCWLPS